MWAAVVSRRPVAFLAANLALVALAVVLALAAPDRLAVGGGLDRDGEVPSEAIVVLTPEAGTSDAVSRQAVAVIRSGLLADPAVRSVEPIESRRGEATILVVDAGLGSALESREIAERAADAIDPGPFELAVGGEPLTQADAGRRLESELPELALLVAPLILLVLLFGFGVRHAAAPVLAAASGAFGGIAVLRLLPASLDLPATGIAVAFAVGLAVGVEAAFLVRKEASPPASGPMVSCAAIGATLAAATLLAVPLPAARSAALGGVFAALIAGGAAFVATTSLLAIFPRQPAEQDAPAGGGVLERIRYGRLGAIVDEIAFRPILSWIPAIAVLAALAFAGAQALDTDAVAFTAADLGAGAEPATVAQTVAGELRPAQAEEINSPSAPVVGGAAELFRSRLPWILAAITIVGLMAAYRATRSARLGIARGIGSALPAAAACGLLVLAADGSLPFELEFIGPEPNAGVLLAALAAIAAVSVARGALATPAGALAGTLIAGGAMGALAGSELDAVAESGVTIAAGLVIDLALVRAILVPSLERALPKGPPRLPDRFRR